MGDCINHTSHVWREGKWDREITCSICGIEMTEARANEMEFKLKQYEEALKKGRIS